MWFVWPSEQPQSPLWLTGAGMPPFWGRSVQELQPSLTRRSGSQRPPHRLWGKCRLPDDEMRRARQQCCSCSQGQLESWCSSTIRKMLFFFTALCAGCWQLERLDQWELGRHDLHLPSTSTRWCPQQRALWRVACLASGLQLKIRSSPVHGHWR